MGFWKVLCHGIYFGDNEENAVEALIDSSRDDERIRNYENGRFCLNKQIEEEHDKRTDSE